MICVLYLKEPSSFFLALHPPLHQEDHQVLAVHHQFQHLQGLQLAGEEHDGQGRGGGGDYLH